MNRFVVPGAIVGAAAFLAWQDERARSTVAQFQDDGTLREDFAMIPSVQRTALAKTNGLSDVHFGRVDVLLPKTRLGDADKFGAYWSSLLARADRESGSDSDGKGPRQTAFEGRIKKAKEAQAISRFAADRPWTSIAERGPFLADAALRLFWDAVQSAATTAHAALTWNGARDRADVWTGLGYAAGESAASLGEWLGRAGAQAGELAAGVSTGFLTAVLAHPLVLGGASIALLIYYRGKG